MAAMSDQKSTLDRLVSEIKQQRDELRLKMHLAGMEAKDEYDRLSGRYDELSKQYEPVSEAVEDTAENLLSALSLAAGELKVGFQRVRKALSESDE
jgi:chromosome segregation ATPase